MPDKLKILKWLMITASLTLLLGLNEQRQIGKAVKSYQIKQQELIQQNDDKQSIIDKQQEYIDKVVTPVKKIMYRNKCYNQEIYEAVMKTFDPITMAIIIELESGYKIYAVSSCGAKGLTQTHPCHGKYSTFDIKANIEFGARYLREGLQKYGTIEKALCRYNAGDYYVNRSMPFETIRYIRKFKEGRN